MSDEHAFGFDPEDFDRVIREAGEGLRDAFDRIGRFLTVPNERAGWSVFFENLARRATLVNCYDVSSGSSSTLTAMPYGKNRTLRDGSVLVLFARNASSSVAYTCST